MNKRGQLEIQETGFIIFIVVLILLIGIVMFFQYQSRSINNLNERYQEYRFEGLISFLPSMPELRYSSLGKEEESIDFYKAKAFSEVSNLDYYENMFGFKRISLKVSGDSVVLYDKRLPGYTGLRKITSPVSVYNPKDGRYYVGVLEVERYV